MAFLTAAITDHFSNPGGLWEILILGLFDFIVNYGWRIVFFTVCLKLLLLPLDLYQRFKMRKNQIITERLQPQIEKLQQQYAGDQRTLSQKQMELNRKEGFSYFSSCLPMIVTLVIFFYLFAGLNNISHFRIFEQYVGLYDAYTAEEVEQKKIGREGVFNTEEIDKLLNGWDSTDDNEDTKHNYGIKAHLEYFLAKAPKAEDYKTDGEWYESDAKYTVGEGDDAVEYNGGEADYMRALAEYNDAVTKLQEAVVAVESKKTAEDKSISWNELNAWQLAVDVTEPRQSDYKNKFGDKKGDWIVNDDSYTNKSGMTYSDGEATYQRDKDGWIAEYYPVSYDLFTKSEEVHKEYILGPAQDAAVEKYGKSQEDFLWISNIWSPDVPWRDAILDWDNFTSNISDYQYYDEVVDELDAKVDEEFNRTTFGQMMNSTTYSRVTGKLRADDRYNGVNGYLILPILSVGLSFLSQFITARLQKKSGQAAPTGGMAGSMKMMMIIMPLMMGVFALTYTAMFTLYIVVNSATTIIINVATTLAMNGGSKSKKNKVLKANGGIQKYGRPDPKDL